MLSVGIEPNVVLFSTFVSAKTPLEHKECRKNTRSASVIMPEFANWLKSLHGIPVFVGYPAGYDFTFVYWYLIKFNGSSPFSFSAIDIKTYAMALMKTSYRDSTKKNMPKNWFPSHPHTHVALDDAIEQGLLFLNMLEENNGNMR